MRHQRVARRRSKLVWSGTVVRRVMLVMFPYGLSCSRGLSGEVEFEAVHRWLVVRRRGWKNGVAMKEKGTRPRQRDALLQIAPRRSEEVLSQMRWLVVVEDEVVCGSSYMPISEQLRHAAASWAMGTGSSVISAHTTAGNGIPLVFYSYILWEDAMGFVNHISQVQSSLTARLLLYLAASPPFVLAA